MQKEASIKVLEHCPKLDQRLSFVSWRSSPYLVLTVMSLHLGQRPLFP